MLPSARDLGARRRGAVHVQAVTSSMRQPRTERTSMVMRRLSPLLATVLFLLPSADAAAQRTVRDQGVSSNYNPLTWFNQAPPVRGLWRMPGITSDYKLGPGDELEIFITNFAVSSVSVTVSTTGEISIPLLGRMPVTDLTAEEVEKRIAEGLRQRDLLREPEVLVNVAEYQAKPIYIFGEVDNQGQYIMTQELTLMQFILMAGGLDFSADHYGFLHRKATSDEGPAPPEKTLLEHPDTAREGWTVTRVDIQPLKEGGVLDPDIPLRAGDVFVVPRSTTRLFYVIGDVNRPGAFEISAERQLLVSQALSTAGGPTKTAKTSHGMLIRYDAKGMREERPVDFAAIIRGTKPDFEVLANDVIFIPGAAAKTLGLGLLNIIPTVLVAPFVF